MGIRWWRLLPLLIAAVAWWGCLPAEAQENARQVCSEGQLGTSIIDAEIQFVQHHQNYIKAYSSMTVKVPRKWSLARDLTFSENSEEYRRAMRCLLRGQEKVDRGKEWRPHDPRVTALADWVTVQYDAFTWITSYGSYWVGPWHISGSDKGTWQVTLDPPCLKQFIWKHVEARLDDLNFDDHSTQAASYADAKKLVWDRQPPESIKIEVDLPWERSFALVYGAPGVRTAGIAAWWLCASGVIVLAALRTRQASPWVAPSTPERYARVSRWPFGGHRSGHHENPAHSVLQWAALSGALALALLLIILQRSISLQWRTVFCIVAGLALILVARPWKRGKSPIATNTGFDESNDPANKQRRQARLVTVTASAVAVGGLLVVLVQALSGLSLDQVSKAAPTASGLAGLTLLGLTVVWLWLAAMVAWAWRFAREGGLARAAWSENWDATPGRWIAAVGLALAVAAGGLLACAWWASEHRWRRVNWLTEQSDAFTHSPTLSQSMATFSFSYLLWIFAYSWLLTVVALLALLYFRVDTQRARATNKSERLALWPQKTDLLLISAVFAFLVGLRGGKIAGAVVLYGIWIPLNMFSLYAVLFVGRRWSVLGRLGDRFHAQRLSTKKQQCELLRKAGRYRDLTHQLYLLDQGHADGTTRQQVEDELHALRRWIVDACDRHNAPERISVLDVALAWGPETHWWSNAMRAARLAFCFGIPASAALVFLGLRESLGWLEFLYEPTGIPDVIADFVLYQLAWAGSGFTLGALWRMLPGRRSPARAWSLVFAYALPVCVAAVFINITDADSGLLLMYSVLMLTVLTLTSIWMDTATFRREWERWPSRFSLLLSIHQVRGLSGQFTWILAQVAVVAGIWRQLTHG